MAEILKDATAKGSHGADPELAQRVAAIIQDIDARGAEAVRRYSAEFDGWSPESFQLSDEEIERVVAGVDPVSTCR